MSEISINEEFRSLFLGYPLAMGGVCILGTCIASPKDSDKSQASTVEPAATEDNNAADSDQEYDRLEDQTPLLESSQQASQSPKYNAHYTWRETAKVSVLAIICGLEVYLYHQFGILAVRHASFDFTAKMLMIVWVMVFASIPMCCLAKSNEAVETITQQSRRIAETSEASGGCSSTSETIDDAGWDSTSTEHQAESKASEEWSRMDACQGDIVISLAERCSIIQSVIFLFWDVVFVVGMFSLAIPLLTIPFA